MTGYDPYGAQFTQPPRPFPAALAPIPDMAEPSIAMTAGADTTAQLTRAVQIQLGRGGGVPGVLGVLLVGAAAAAALGSFWLAIPYAAIAVIVAVLMFLRILLAGKALHTAYAKFSYPGAQLAVRFGPDAMDLRTDVNYGRTSYADIRKIAVRGPAVVLLLRQIPLAYPRELFPDEAIALIRSQRKRR